MALEELGRQVARYLGAADVIQRLVTGLDANEPGWARRINRREVIEEIGREPNLGQEFRTMLAELLDREIAARQVRSKRL